MYRVFKLPLFMYTYASARERCSSQPRVKPIYIADTTLPISFCVHVTLFASGFHFQIRVVVINSQVNRVM